MENGVGVVLKQELRSIEGNETKDTIMAIIYKATATKNTLDAAKNEVNVRGIQISICMPCSAAKIFAPRSFASTNALTCSVMI